jgi:hypothetical protein
MAGAKEGKQAQEDGRWIKDERNNNCYLLFYREDGDKCSSKILYNVRVLDQF